MTAAAIVDRCRETTVTTGTGPLNLAGAVTGFRTLLAGIGAGIPCYYVITHRTANQWEVGEGTVTAGTPDTLTRTTVLQSSNAGALLPRRHIRRRGLWRQLVDRN